MSMKWIAHEVRVGSTTLMTHETVIWMLLCNVHSHELRIHLSNSIWFLFYSKRMQQINSIYSPPKTKQKRELKGFRMTLRQCLRREHRARTLTDCVCIGRIAIAKSMRHAARH